MRKLLVSAAVCGMLACTGDSKQPQVSVRSVFNLEGAFLDAPFPIASRDRGDGTIDMSGFQVRPGAPVLEKLVNGLETIGTGFGTTSAVYLPFNGSLDATTLTASIPAAATDSVQLINIDDSSPRFGERAPLWLSFRAEAQSYTPANTLALLPRPGTSLAPAAWYAAIVVDQAKAADQGALGAADDLAALLDGSATTGNASLDMGFAKLRAYLAAESIDPNQVVAATVYRTGDPTAALIALRQKVYDRGVPAASGLTQLRDHPTMCVVEGQLTVPLLQSGTSPFKSEGGAIDPSIDPSSAPEQSIRFAVSIPKATMPAAGFPLVFYSAGQGGSYTQLIDRATGEAFIEGEGIAKHLANGGIATISIEAPLVGPRHPNGDTSGLEFFNAINPAAFRDNTKQAALDFTSLIRMSGALSIPEGLCAGATGTGGNLSFDSDRFFFYGHSTGATVGALVVGLEPQLRAAALSGYGGSWLYNLTIKRLPFDFGQLVAVLLKHKSGDPAELHDLSLNLAQTLWASSEAINWTRHWSDEPAGDGTHTLIIAGVEDGFFPPPSQNAAAIAARSDLLAPETEPTLVEAITPFGGSMLSGPAGMNIVTPGGKSLTSLIVQHPMGATFDGHYVPFELGAPKHQLRCFFESNGEKVPVGNSDPAAACP